MKNSKDSKKTIWTIFKIERSPEGVYNAKTSIDQSWLIKQSGKISNIDGKVTFIVADLFVELVYGCSFSDRDKRWFLTRLKRKLRKIKNFAGVLTESEAVEKLWSKQEFTVQFEKEKTLIKKISQIELSRRKSLYNPKNFEIDSKELYDIALKARAALNTEEVLTSLLINYNN